MSQVVILLKEGVTWAPGKTYEVTVDANATDALGKKLGAPVSASFTMSAQ
jgi:hypothetical protein